MILKPSLSGDEGPLGPGLGVTTWLVGEGAGLMIGRGGGGVASTIFKILLRGATGRGVSTIGGRGGLAAGGVIPTVAPVPAEGA